MESNGKKPNDEPAVAPVTTVRTEEEKRAENARMEQDRILFWI